MKQFLYPLMVLFLLFSACKSKESVVSSSQTEQAQEDPRTAIIDNKDNSGSLDKGNLKFDTAGVFIGKEKEALIDVEFEAFSGEMDVEDPRTVVLDGEDELEVFEKGDLRFDSTGVYPGKEKEALIIKDEDDYSGEMTIGDPRKDAMTGSKGNVKQKDQTELVSSRKGDVIDENLESGKKCKKKKKPKKEEPVEGEVLVVERNKATPFTLGMLDTPEKADLLFSIKGVSIEEKNLRVEVQYGGGCVKPHVFELLTDGIIDANGNMKFQLLHRTHNDLCKALIMETLVFDFSRLYDLNSEKLKSFTINQQRKMDFK